MHQAGLYGHGTGFKGVCVPRAHTGVWLKTHKSVNVWVAIVMLAQLWGVCWSVMPPWLPITWEHEGAVPAVAGAQAWEQLCFSWVMPRHATQCPRVACTVPVMPACHQLFSTVLASRAAGEQVAGTAVLVSTSLWGSGAGPAGKDGAASVDVLFRL